MNNEPAISSHPTIAPPHPGRRRTLTIRLAGGLAAATLLLAACGSDGDDAGSSDNAPTTEAPSNDTPTTEAEAAPAASGDLVSVGDTEIGPVLVDGAGLTLYGFTPDEGGTPTCEDACADAWPPIVVPDASLPAGLDAAVFSVVERSDGSFQLAAGGWPLYLFAGDGAPGDVNGQGSGDVWFAAAPDGSLIGVESAAPATSGYDY